MQLLGAVVLILLAISVIQSRKLSLINNDYAFKMHRTLIAGDANVLTSPISYLTQLGILQFVADGNTVKEIRRSVGYDSTVSREQVHSFFSEIIGRLRNQTQNSFKMANVIVLRNDYPTVKGIEAKLKDFYNTSVQVYDIYQAQETMESINELIRENTDGVFEQFLISPLDRYNRLAMLNSVRFSGIWQHQFECEQRGYFHNKGKNYDLSLLPMMSVRGKFYSAKLNIYGIEVTAVELPYENSDLKMLILLPDGAGLENLVRIEQKITSRGLSQIVNAMTEKNVKVILPSFELHPGFDLMWSIQFLGVRDAFNNAADFHRLSEEKGLFVTKVLHKMVFGVDVNGRDSQRHLNTVDEVFVANRPFLFFVRDTTTEMVVFMGRIVSLASK